MELEGACENCNAKLPLGSSFCPTCKTYFPKIRTVTNSNDSSASNSISLMKADKNTTLFSEARIDSPTVTQIFAGDELEILGQTDYFYKVKLRFGTDAGVIGYIERKTGTSKRRHSARLYTSAVANPNSQPLDLDSKDTCALKDDFVFEDASINSNKICPVCVGDSIRIIGESGDYFYVELPLSPNRQGYISKDTVIYSGGGDEFEMLADGSLLAGPDYDAEIICPLLKSTSLLLLSPKDNFMFVKILSGKFKDLVGYVSDLSNQPPQSENLHNIDDEIVEESSPVSDNEDLELAELESVERDIRDDLKTIRDSLKMEGISSDIRQEMEKDLEKKLLDVVLKKERLIRRKKNQTKTN